MKRTVFLSYSSPQSEAATRIELSLKGEGHAVFRDRTDLPPGESFDARIRAAIDDSDLFIFLISHQSVSPGRYTLTELKFAEEKWGHPAGHVLPVLTEPVPKESIPAFLRAVTMLQPTGDLAAEVSAAVERMTQPWWRWFSKPAGLAVLVLVALLIAGSIWRAVSLRSERNAQARQATEILKQSEAHADAGNYDSAWKLLDQAAAIQPASAEITDAQERLAMQWLENARGNQRSGTLKEIADRVASVLSRGAARGRGERSADLAAHLGWAEFLRLREGVTGLDPTKHYRRALEIDRDNVFAHAMWGFEILRRRGPVAEAKQHFAIALQSRRNREYVRHMQFSALLWVADRQLESEAIRVANEMRQAGETMPSGPVDASDRSRLWNVYHSRLIFSHDKPLFLATLSPADHLATFRWLFPEDQITADKNSQYLYMLAQLQELNGDRAAALEAYRGLQRRLRNSPGSLLDGTNAAIERLSR